MKTRRGSWVGITGVGFLVLSLGGCASVPAPFAALVRGKPEAHGMAADLADRIRAELERQVARKAFPGAVALVMRNGVVVAELAVGRETYAADAPPITVDTVYDMASLTKVCATLPAVAFLLDRGVLTLDDPLAKWVPEFGGMGKSAGREGAGKDGTPRDKVTLRHVMVHSSGLPAYIRFFLQGLQGKANYVAACAATALEYEPGTKYIYSDLGLILMMAVVERASGKTLDRFLAEEVYPKLGVKARFGKSGEPLDAAPTEEDSWRGRLVRGEVHDENSFAMGGVSGHAGLFGTAEDIARIGDFFLRDGAGLIAPELAIRLRTRDDMVPDSTRALLWDTFKPGGAGGNKLSAGSFGHTGFTGTSIWCDPERRLCMVLLTNRVHPTRKNRKIFGARRAFHDLVVDSVLAR